MIHCTICLNIREDVDFDEALRAYREAAARCDGKEGCLYFHVHPGERAKRQIVLWEIWEDRDALEENHRSDFTQALFAKGYAAGPPAFAAESEE